MALEELIVAWTKERPAWQREVMRRVAAGDALSDDDYDSLVQSILHAKEVPAPEFGLEHLPQAAPEDLPVCILAIEKPEHVNALESTEPLTFEPLGLTIVYGDNASGKSGYARLLKRITRARHREDVLTDVFRDTSLAKPTAELRVRIGDAEESLAWPDSPRPELQRVRFYDAACGSDYVASESDFPYRPSALFVMDGLIEACVAVRARIDAKLAENGASTNQLPAVAEQVREGDAGRFLASLSGESSVEALDALIAKFDGAGETVEELKDQEARLRSADTSRARQQLTRQSEKIVALRNHIESLDAAVGNAAVTELRQRQGALKALEEADILLAQSFESEPLPGVGSSAWKALWEAARRFSKEQAYAGRDFPFLGDECRCVLCQQLLEPQSRDRLVRFDEFVRNDTQVRHEEARRAYDRKVKALRDLTASPEVVSNNLKDIEGSSSDLVAEVRELLARYEAAIEKVREAVSNQQECPHIGIDHAPIVTRLTEASNAAKASAEELEHPEGIQKQLAALTARRADLELLEQVKKSRSTIVMEIARLREREALDGAKSAAATTGITKKILEFSEESITEVVRDTFTRETDRLRLERVTIARTRADRGALLHQPKLVGARQQVTLPRVFSEGERTALGLAAFFTEAQLDSSRSALILDDPVTSLDHIRRGLVASRLAALAENRQVILFTHDVAFVADLRREASARDVLIAERSVTRSRAEERKPGVCTKNHPWKTKDVPARLDELRRELGRIRRDCGTWAENQYEEAVAVWAGNLSETWERIFSQEVVGPVLAEGGLEVRPMMVKVIARFSDEDHREFDASYSRTSQWAKRHDKSAAVNYVAPDVDKLDEELRLVESWFKRVKGYKA
jgi:energy-coupling factor transporter ATP-binding protein EcfA2/antitoxin component HigA of HigAB toxin-antitoxin module